MVTWRAWGIPVRCGAGMVALQTLLALYHFGDRTALRQLVNPLMWIGLGHWLGGGTPSPRHDRLVPHAAAGRDVPGHPRGRSPGASWGGYSALLGSCSMA